VLCVKLTVQRSRECLGSHTRLNFLQWLAKIQNHITLNHLQEGEGDRERERKGNIMSYECESVRAKRVCEQHLLDYLCWAKCFVASSRDGRHFGDEGIRALLAPRARTCATSVPTAIRLRRFCSAAHHQRPYEISVTRINDIISCQLLFRSVGWVLLTEFVKNKKEIARQQQQQFSIRGRVREWRGYAILTFPELVQIRCVFRKQREA
jgi:hypothetical protein